MGLALGFGLGFEVLLEVDPVTVEVDVHIAHGLPNLRGGVGQGGAVGQRDVVEVDGKLLPEHLQAA